MARVIRARSGGVERPSAPSFAQHLALAVFALLIIAAPLAFGTVDRLTQVILLTVLAAGLALRPAAPMHLSRAGNLLVLVGIAVLLAKEFAPATLFGRVAWREVLTQSYGMSFPWTHHPEPARALDALLAAIAGTIWFLWVRTLTADRGDRVIVAWTLVAAAAAVAVVSFATRGIDPQAIYGLRYTPGWHGFGPFPNRNHTASFLAMGAIIGCGCATWAAMRRRYAGTAAGIAAVALIVAALLASQSRGGLLSLALGLTVFLALVVVKLRDRRALGIAAAAVALTGVLALVFGGQVIARFFPDAADAGMAHYARLNVWRDAAGMWKDAPLFGHGAASFPQIFPMYQQIELVEQVVLHPESSWLQWLAELGAAPVLLGILAFGGIVVTGLRSAFARRNSFFLHAAGIAAVLALLGHSFIDVPAHRWGTAAFALAALALAFPRSDRQPPLAPSRKCALIPLGIAGFWALPFFFGGPSWSPLALNQLIARARTTGRATEAELQRALQHFPLSPALHQAIGVVQIDTGGDPAAWQRHFQIAARLVPASWSIVAEQAIVSARVSPGYALHCWQRALERAGHRRDEIFRLALQQTRGLPGAEMTWESYAEAQPDLLLVYAGAVPPDTGRAAYDTWWEKRGRSAAQLAPVEITEFYALAPKFGNADQLNDWIARHAELAPRDATRWAALFHGWGADERAWELLSGSTAEPDFPKAPPGAPVSELEHVWETNPGDLVNARAFAHALALIGRDDRSREVIVAVAQREKAPPWFVQKAAHLLAKQGDSAKAVAIALRQPE